MKLLKNLLLLTVLLFGLAPTPGTAAADSKIRVTATTSMVTDLVKGVGGDRVEVSGLMGAGVDPHLYKATPDDFLIGNDSPRHFTSVNYDERCDGTAFESSGTLEQIFVRPAYASDQAFSTAFFS